jgi:nucleoid-associated protein YgaU
MANKGLFGLFGNKKEEEAKKAEAAKKDLTRKTALADQEKAKADMFLKQEEMMKAAKEKAAKEVKKHVVVKGDTLSGIAKKYYNDAGKYMKIYEANKDVIGSNPDLIKPGQELIIPKL